MAQMQSIDQQFENKVTAIKTRRVHYFSGFDPRGAAYYLRLFKEEALKPTPNSGAVQVGRRRKVPGGMSAWDVQWGTGSNHVKTEHVFMSWDDIIRESWSRKPMVLLVEFFRAYMGILFDVRLSRVRQIFHSVYLTGILPAVFLMGALLLGVLIGVMGQLTATALVPQPMWSWLAVLFAWSVAVASVYAAWSYGQRKGVFWLLRIFHFVVQMGRRPVPGLASRTRAWVDQIVHMQEKEPVDEVILVGHSVGTLVMVDTVDALLQDERWQRLQVGRKTGMLTLGHCYPFVAMVPAAVEFREKLRRLSFDARLLWWDVTARIDPLCFFKAHPLVKTGVPHRGAPNPVMHDARFFQMYEPEHWQQIRKDKLLAHFLYLMTPDRSGNFHLYDVLYGPKPFAQQVNQGSTHVDTAKA